MAVFVREFDIFFIKPLRHDVVFDTLFPLKNIAPISRIGFADEIKRLKMAKKGKGKKKLETMFLVCEETGDYNYTIRKKAGGEKIQVKKYSPRLRKHTMHIEKKK